MCGSKQKQNHWGILHQICLPLFPIRLFLPLVTSARVISVRDSWFCGNNTAPSKTENPRAICRHNTSITATGWQRDRSSCWITCDAWSVCRNMLFHLLVQIGGNGSIQMLSVKTAEHSAFSLWCRKMFPSLLWLILSAWQSVAVSHCWTVSGAANLYRAAWIKSSGFSAHADTTDTWMCFSSYFSHLMLYEQSAASRQFSEAEPSVCLICSQTKRHLVVHIKKEGLHLLMV